MKNRFYLILFILSFALQLNAQNSYYFISFKDKDTTNFSKLIPENFLSIKSIERKKKFKLPDLTINDLPVNKIYIDTIVPFVHQHLQTLKWFNGIVVLANNNLTDTLKGFKFIKDITLIGYEKDNEFFKEIDLLEKVNLLEKKFEKDEKVDSSLYYGFATNVIYFNKIQKLHQLNLKGKNIDIAVIDVGFNDAVNNPYFKNSNIKKTFTFSDNQNDFHGLSVLGCLAANIPYQYVGAAPEANYYLFSSENVNFEYPIEEYYWARSAEIADSIGVDLISSSLGYSEFDGKKFNHKHKDLNGNKTTIAKAANIALANGMAVIISAGNEGDNLWETITTPADVENVLTVGSCNEEKNVSAKIARPSQKRMQSSVTKHHKPEIILKGHYERKGLRLNQLGTVECGILINGSTEEYSIKVDRIIAWSSTRPKFDISPFHGIFNNAEFRKQYSNRQREAIDNVYYKWEVFMQFA
jgi:hypothetical protein